MNILYIAPLPPPLNGHSLAAQVFHEALVSDHALDIVNLNKKSFTQGIDSFRRIKDVLLIFLKVFKKQRHADLIYLTISESLFGNIKDLVIYLLCYRKLKNMYIHLHGGSLKKLLFDRYKVIAAINRFFLRRLAGVIILGDSHLEIFDQLVKKENIYIVPNFSQEYLFLSDAEVVDKFNHLQPVHMVFISNMIEEKGYLDILEAFLKLTPTEQAFFQIDFAGRFDADHKKENFLAKIKSIKQIKYHGEVNGAEKKHLFAAAHLFCLPTSFFEGQPISILEAYAAGCVVLATRMGGIGDIFQDAVNGFEISTRSPDAVKQIFERVLSNKDKLLSIARHNKKIAEEKYKPASYNAALKTVMKIS